MSLDATRWAWQRTGVRAADKLVLLSLADRAGERHQCWPSIDRLKSDTCLDPKTVRAALERLEIGGLIRATRHNGAATVFTLLGVGNRHDAAAKNEADSADFGAEKSDSTPAKNGTPTPTKNGRGSKGADPYRKRYPTPTKNGRGPLPKTVPEPTNNLPLNLTTTTLVGFESVSDGNATGVPDCPHLEIISLYNAVLPSLPQVLVSRWSGTRARNLLTRWREDPKHQQLAFWRWLFGQVARNRFYLGENDRGWRADLGWLLEKRNFDRILERSVDAQRRSALA